MPVHLQQIPRDDSGVVKGQFRLRHRNPAFTEALGPVVFRHGVSVAPVTGVTLERMVAMLGHDLELEPWPEEAPAVATVIVGRPVHVAIPPEATAAEIARTINDATAPLACASVAEPQDEDLPEDRDALVAIAAARGVTIDSSWGRKRLRRAILEHV